MREPKALVTAEVRRWREDDIAGLERAMWQYAGGEGRMDLSWQDGREATTHWGLL